MSLSLNSSLVSALEYREKKYSTTLRNRVTMSSELGDPRYRHLVRRAVRRVQYNHRKVFKTRIFGGGGGLPMDDPTNPVYDLKYSPVVYRGHRVLAVGDELGFVSIVRVGIEGGSGGCCGKGNGKGEEKIYSAVSIRADQNEGNTQEHDSTIQPVVYSLAWAGCGQKIVAGYGDGSIRIWDLGKADEPVSTANLKVYDLSIKRVMWRGEDSSTLVSCSRSNEIMVHDLRMRDPTVNRIDCCKAVNSKLTDIRVVDGNYVVSCSSNSSRALLWDLRLTYKLYKRVIPVTSYHLGSSGIVTMAADSEYSTRVFALGADGVVGSFDWREGTVEKTKYKVPGTVDFFSKMDVDEGVGVLVCGSAGESAFGFDVMANHRSSEHDVGPFFELKHGRAERKLGDEVEELEEVDKENVPVDRDTEDMERCCSAVAIATRRGSNDSFFQVATGGDDACVTAWD